MIQILNQYFKITEYHSIHIINLPKFEYIQIDDLCRYNLLYFYVFCPMLRYNEYKKNFATVRNFSLYLINCNVMSLFVRFLIFIWTWTCFNLYSLFVNLPCFNYDFNLRSRKLLMDSLNKSFEDWSKCLTSKMVLITYRVSIARLISGVPQNFVIHISSSE